MKDHKTCRNWRLNMEIVDKTLKRVAHWYGTATVSRYPTGVQNVSEAVSWISDVHCLELVSSTEWNCDNSLKHSFHRPVLAWCRLRHIMCNLCLIHFILTQLWKSLRKQYKTHLLCSWDFVLLGEYCFCRCFFFFNSVCWSPFVGTVGDHVFKFESQDHACGSQSFSRDNNWNVFWFRSCSFWDSSKATTVLRLPHSEMSFWLEPLWWSTPIEYSCTPADGSQGVVACFSCSGFVTPKSRIWYIVCRPKTAEQSANQIYCRQKRWLVHTFSEKGNLGWTLLCTSTVACERLTSLPQNWASKKGCVFYHSFNRSFGSREERQILGCVLWRAAPELYRLQYTLCVVDTPTRKMTCHSFFYFVFVSDSYLWKRFFFSFEGGQCFHQQIVFTNFGFGGYASDFLSLQIRFLVLVFLPWSTLSCLQ